jgi:hypothetical protein
MENSSSNRGCGRCWPSGCRPAGRRCWVVDGLLMECPLGAGGCAAISVVLAGPVVCSHVRGDYPQVMNSASL